MLLELELGRILLQYVDEPDVVKVIKLSEHQGGVHVTRPPVQSTARLSQPRAAMRAHGHIAHPARGARQQRLWRPSGAGNHALCAYHALPLHHAAVLAS